MDKSRHGRQGNCGQYLREVEEWRIHKELSVVVGQGNPP